MIFQNILMTDRQADRQTGRISESVCFGCVICELQPEGALRLRGIIRGRDTPFLYGGNSFIPLNRYIRRIVSPLEGTGIRTVVLRGAQRASPLCLSVPLFAKRSLREDE